MPVDTKLIADAQLRATGASVHAVAEAMANYRAWTDRGDMALRKAAQWERYLRAFVATGAWPADKPKRII